MNRLLVKKEIDVRVILKKSFKGKDGKEVNFTEVLFLSDGEMCKATTSKEGLKEGKQFVNLEVLPKNEKSLKLKIK